MDDRLRRIADYLLNCKDWAAFDPASVAALLLPHIFVIRIERDSPDHSIRLRVRLAGTALDTVFAQPLAGRCIEEFMHGPRSADVLRGFQRCAENHMPVWMRQVVCIRNQLPRYVEGIAIYLEPERIYGGLIVGEIESRAFDDNEATFESMSPF